MAVRTRVSPLFGALGHTKPARAVEHGHTHIGLGDLVSGSRAARGLDRRSVYSGTCAVSAVVAHSAFLSRAALGAAGLDRGVARMRRLPQRNPAALGHHRGGPARLSFPVGLTGVVGAIATDAGKGLIGVLLKQGSASPLPERRQVTELVMRREVDTRLKLSSRKAFCPGPVTPWKWPCITFCRSRSSPTDSANEPQFARVTGPDTLIWGASDRP